MPLKVPKNLSCLTLAEVPLTNLFSFAAHQDFLWVKASQPGQPLRPMEFLEEPFFATV